MLNFKFKILNSKLTGSFAESLFVALPYAKFRSIYKLQVAPCKCKIQNSKFKINRIDNLAEYHFAAVLYAVIVISVRKTFPPGEGFLCGRGPINIVDELANSSTPQFVRNSLPCYAEMLDLINFEFCILNFE